MRRRKSTVSFNPITNKRWAGEWTTTFTPPFLIPRYGLHQPGVFQKRPHPTALPHLVLPGPFAYYFHPLPDHPLFWNGILSFQFWSPTRNLNSPDFITTKRCFFTMTSSGRFSGTRFSSWQRPDRDRPGAPDRHPGQHPDPRRNIYRTIVFMSYPVMTVAVESSGSGSTTKKWPH